MLLILLAYTIFSTVRLSGGHMFYTLDDAYIHLAVAEEISRGGYGINSGQYASPSSSMIYPYLLSYGIGFGISDLTPIIILSVFGLFSVWMFVGFYWEHAVNRKCPASVIFAFVSLPFIVTMINATGLIATGMEHMIHVFATIAAIVGVSEIGRRRSSSLSLALLGAAIAPLVRFEGLALSFGVLLILLYRRHFISSLLLVSVIGLFFLTYFSWTQSVGLPMLPSPILVKSSAISAAAGGHIESIFFAVFQNIKEAILGYRGGRSSYLLLFFPVVAMFTLGAGIVDSAPKVNVLMVTLIVVLAHLSLGDYDGWSRYEVYVIAAIAMATILVFSDFLISGDCRSSCLKSFALLGAVFLIAANYFSDTKSSPDASQKIYSQQYQMHRFATKFFPEPVAVNDLGWVSYNNDNYVLDLWGLGSEEARIIRTHQGYSAKTLNQLVENHSIPFAMIFEEWFVGAIPEKWCRVATLSSPEVSPGDADVAFFVVDVSRESEVRAAISLFAEGVPETTIIRHSSCEERKFR